ncbi:MULTISPECIES: O-antigen polysaccharide polymerase Wzy [unclassified Aerococcus]|uniref:O-antigen polysaccharide polymerase Wzy n=1 Tax=unclassified Aerococcus TaxID=2618060 RepID=UPI0008A31B2F|nr:MULTISPECIES: O-antigen polysaccharide polymerase Wzy [unclassified Aerococcus]MDK6856397.1 O-antigen polysaccharide polymerase Wzy [Aerococcus sp. UMB7533]OFN05338.1 hypothetical protein HMPREF2626_03460 [Aerococcus sp. HMSC062A02]OHO42779.1 hypothetical protein HMPREF2705_02635 [Aerococcus sp. HMSC035B07]
MTNIKLLTSINKIIILILYLALILISAFVCSKSSEIYFLSNFSIVSFIILIVTFCLFKFYTKTLFSFSSIFILLLYLFHFGQVYLNVIDYSFGKYKMNFIEYYSINELKSTLIFSFLIIFLTSFGILIKISFYRKNYEFFSKYRINLSKSQFKKLAFSFFGLVFPIKFYRDFSLIRYSINGGYLKTLEAIEEGSGVVTAFSLIAYTAIIMLILSNYPNKIKMRGLIFLFAGYEIITMLSGGRGIQMVFLLLLVYIYHNFVEKLNFKGILSISLIGYILISFLNIIAVSRNFSSSMLPSLSTIHSSLITNNPILDLIAELGGTIQTPIEIMRQVPYYLSFGKGNTFIGGIFRALPNIGGFLNQILEETNFMSKIKASAPGGSYIGELYYNFGYYAYPFAILFGVIIEFISKKISNTIVNKNLFEFCLFVPIFILGLWWVRNYFSEIVRVAIWNAILLLTLNYFINKVFFRKDRSRI